MAEIVAEQDDRYEIEPVTEQGAWYSGSALGRLMRRLWLRPAEERFRALEEEPPVVEALSGEGPAWYCLSNRAKNIYWTVALVALGFAAIGLESLRDRFAPVVAELPSAESGVLASQSETAPSATLEPIEPIEPPRPLDVTLLQAARLEVPPVETPPPVPESIKFDPAPNSAPVGEPVLLVVTARTKEGESAGEAAAEWSLDRHGVGEITVVPGSEATAKATERVLPTFVRTYTATEPYEVRLSDSEDDSVEIGAGQTWLVVQSSVPGETTVSVVAPAVESLPRRRIVHRIAWVSPVKEAPKAPEPPPLAAMPIPALAREPAAKLVLRKQLPKVWWVGRSAPMTVTVENQGAADAFGIRIVDDVPFGLKIEQSDAVVSEGRLQWNIDHLTPGASRTFTVTASPQQVFDGLLLRTQAFESGRQSCEILTNLTARGVAALSLEVRDATDPVPLGGEIEYVIGLKNTGSVSASDVRLQVSVSLPAGAKPVNVEGSLKGSIRGSDLAFEPIAELAAGQALSCKLRVKPTLVGEVRLSCRLAHPSLGPQGVLAQESSVVYRP